MSDRRDAGGRAAMLAAFAMIAHQVAGKATRDALFLSTYAVTSLPYMIMAAAALSITVAVAASRLISRRSPAAVMPGAFAASAVLQIGEWALALESPRIAAVMVYLHMSSLGAVLISGFWSAVNERFDPRAAKKQIGRIAGAATLGGLVGGLLAERVASQLSIAAMLPFLAILHLGSAGAMRRIGHGSARPPAEPASGWQVLRDVPYLRMLGALVLAATAAGVLVDYAFKAIAADTYRGADLLRFFGLFYGAAGLVTFLLQTSFSRLSLEKLGLAKTVSLLPAVVSAGGIVSLLAPGVASVASARAAEFMLRNSLFRSAYELLFTPISRREKRATKALIDVGFERLGDMTGGGLIRILLLFSPAAGVKPVLWTAVILGGLALAVTMRLGRGYVSALESSLIRRVVQLDSEDVQDSTTRTAILRRVRQDDTIMAASPFTQRGGEQQPPDPLSALRSGDPVRVRPVLANLEHLDRSVTTEVIPLLASRQFAPEALAALRRVAPRIIGLLSDYLLDPDQDFAVRRRIPRVLASNPSPRTVNALLLGFQDPRFEIRYQCGRALAALRDREPALEIPEAAVLAAVKNEVSVGQRVWESQRALEGSDDKEEPPGIEDVLRARANRSLEHVFTLLGLMLPKEPLRMAWLGLHTSDEQVRGTALEYLESVLPEEVREPLWPYLEDTRKQRETGRSREEIVSALVDANPSIQISFAELQKEWESRKKNGETDREKT